MGVLLFLGPDQQTLFGHLVHQTQQVQRALNQAGASALIAPVLGGPLAHLGTLVNRDSIKPVLACFAAGQNPGAVELTGSAAAVGFAAFAPQAVEGALDHGLRALELAQHPTQGGEGAPELLTELGQVFGQSDSFIQ